MAFHLFPDLPLELRRQIIKEAVATWMAERPRNERISAAASLDTEWKYVVERTLFRDIAFAFPRDLDDFAAICGPRNGLLKRVTCNFAPWNHFTFPTAPGARAAFTAAISQLFGIMKDWSRPDRNTLITVCIRVSVPNDGYRYELSIEPVDLLNLPEVPVIGKLYAQLGFAQDVILSHGTIAGLHAKLPNLHGTQLALPTDNGAHLWEATRNAYDNIIATHALKPGLTKLRIISNSTWNTSWAARVDRDTQIAVARSLAPSLSVWKNSLVSLKLDCMMDVPQLLLVAGNTVWPNLDRMDLVGVMDSNVSAFRLRDDQVDACDDLLRGLAQALPSMPALAKVGTRFGNTHNDHFAFSFCMDIGARRGVERQLRQLTEHSGPHKCAIPACRPVPAEHAIARAQGIVPPGNLVTSLQRAVRRERGLEMAVFCCTEKEPWDLNYDGAPCSQWDGEAWEWEPVLMGEMNPLIYTIGQYWEMGVEMEMW